LRPFPVLVVAQGRVSHKVLQVVRVVAVQAVVQERQTKDTQALRVEVGLEVLRAAQTAALEFFRLLLALL